MEIFHNDWAEFLNPELKKPYYLELRKFLVDEYKTRQIFPDMYDILMLSITQVIMIQSRDFRSRPLSW